MARTVKPEEYALKRNQIVEAALRQMIEKGFNKLVIQDILDEIRISSGAFHHYFDSRDALLDAIIDRILQESEKPLSLVVHDPQMTALQKLQGFFGTIDSLRTAHKAEAARLSRVWYSDENALVRRKMDEAVVERRAPLLNEIVRQGIREGVFTVPYPDLAGEIILSLVQGMGNAHVKLLRWATQESSRECTDEIVDGIVAAHAAYMDAIERALAAPANCLNRVDAEAVLSWVTAMREFLQEKEW